MHNQLTEVGAREREQMKKKTMGFLQEWRFLRNVCCPALMGAEEIKDP